MDSLDLADKRAIARLRPEIEHLETSKIAEVWQLGFGRERLIPLWVGESDLPTPGFISEAAIASLRAGETFYTHKRGLPELRQALAGYTSRLYDIEVDVARVTVTGSAMNAIMLVLQSVVGPGDNVVVLTPVWPNILQAIEIVGGRVKPVALEPLPQGGFRLDLARLAAAVDARTRALFINSPGNPSGWLAERHEQQAILELARARGLWLIGDEVYARLVYDRPVAPSFLELAEPDEPLIVINSFSKTWAMTGWRIGWLTHPAALAANFDRLIEYNTSGGQAFLQRGCITAVTDGEPFVAEMVERCRRGGELVFQRLSGLPRLRIARPSATFYSFFALDGMHDSLAFAKQLLHETDVGLSPGAAFGPGGEGHLRLCFASSAERLSEAMDRLVPALS